MKTPINFLTMTISLLVLAIILSATDCGPIDVPEGEFPPNGYRDPVPPKIPRDFEDDTITGYRASDISLTLEEAMARIDPDVHPEWGIDIKAYSCVERGQTLLVYNPNAHSLHFYDSPLYSIHWFKDGRPVRGINIRLECACKGEYAVIVLNKRTQQGVGIAFYSVVSCYANEATSKAIDN